MAVADPILCLLFLACGIFPLVFGRLFGAVGLQVYAALCVVLANIQVLKATPISFLPDPVAMGTVVFASLFLVTDILTEVYGAVHARKAVALGFCASLVSVVIMTLTIWAPPPNPADFPVSQFQTAHNAMEVLFTPAPRILAASLIAYVISQLNDIWIFHLLKQKTGRRFLWLRSNLSTLLSAFLDNTIFSVLAWVLLASTPLDWHTVIFTYILGTLGLRILLSFLNTFFLYGARGLLRKSS
ncbi:MAG: queuosine precursor transporter [bacterium]|nr:queuosine precursor transporter [bacterium]